MAREHVRAALALGLEPDRIEILARREERARALAEEAGTRWRAGGVEALREPPAAAVVAVGVRELADVARALADLGCPFVLLEKPGALERAELDALTGPSVFVALNRRFYPSVTAARRMIEEDGGVLAGSFDFTEIEGRVLAENHPPDVLARWGIVNSLHVIDLFRHLAGEPALTAAERGGTLRWHPAGATFAGAGTLANGALFSYVAAWGGAGRWSVEVTTAGRKLVLRPLEELRVQRKGSFELSRIDAVEEEPAGLKPGLHGQLAAFLAHAGGGPADPRLCSLSDAAASYRLTETILGYR
jgi:predicted dehydrogenase